MIIQAWPDDDRLAMKLRESLKSGDLVASHFKKGQKTVSWQIYYTKNNIEHFWGDLPEWEWIGSSDTRNVSKNVVMSWLMAARLEGRI